jgi:hypothetical protein
LFVRLHLLRQRKLTRRKITGVVSSKRLIEIYGNPAVDTLNWERRNMTVYDVPESIEKLNGFIPKKIYCHKKFVLPLTLWFQDMASTGVIKEINSFGGCFNIRNKRGASTLSIHAFGMAVDFNASHNPLGLTKAQAIARGLKPLSDKFDEVARKYVDCGIDWKTRPDGMHYQIKDIDAYT